MPSKTHLIKDKLKLLSDAYLLVWIFYIHSTHSWYSKLFFGFFLTFPCTIRYLWSILSIMLLFLWVRHQFGNRWSLFDLNIFWKELGILVYCSTGNYILPLSESFHGLRCHHYRGWKLPSSLHMRSFGTTKILHIYEYKDLLVRE